MNTITHRLDHLSESLGQSLRRLWLLFAQGLLSGLDRWATQNPAQSVTSDDDIGWDDGEPEPRH